MHTAFELKNSMFSVTLNGAPADRDALLEWDVRDRLGVLIDRPVGALGAGLLILLTITAFYDARGKKRRMQPMYPDIYLFHVGGPWGSFMPFDFFPEHKEVFLPADGREVLRAVNHCGITHLVLPEKPRRELAHYFKETEAAIDRIKQCYLYSPSGSVDSGDVTIETQQMSVLDNFDAVLDLDIVLTTLAARPNAIPMRLRAPDNEEARLAYETVRARVRTELKKDHPDHQAAVARIQQARLAGKLSETLRRSHTADVLDMLASTSISSDGRSV